VGGEREKRGSIYLGLDRFELNSWPHRLRSLKAYLEKKRVRSIV
jgi:hypothetical protein